MILLLAYFYIIRVICGVNTMYGVFWREHFVAFNEV